MKPVRRFNFISGIRSLTAQRQPKHYLQRLLRAGQPIGIQQEHNRLLVPYPIVLLVSHNLVLSIRLLIRPPI